MIGFGVVHTTSWDEGGAPQPPSRRCMLGPGALQQPCGPHLLGGVHGKARSDGGQTKLRHLPDPASVALRENLAGNARSDGGQTELRLS